MTRIATLAAACVSGATEEVARPNGVRNWMFSHGSPRLSARSAICAELLVVPLRDGDVHPELDAARGVTQAVLDPLDRLLERLGHADLLRVRPRVRAVHAEEQRRQPRPHELPRELLVDVQRRPLVVTLMRS